jgi:hypothetical protein
MGAHLPGAVVEVDQPLHDGGGRAGGRADLRAGDDAALKPAGVDRGGLPLPGDAPGNRVRLGEAGRRQLELGATAEAGGLDAFDMAVRVRRRRVTPGWQRGAVRPTVRRQLPR